MSTDTFDLFQPRERGRFGESELSPERGETRKSDLVDLDLSYCGKGPASISVKKPGDPRLIRLPLSQIEYSMISKGEVRVTLPEWLAKKEGLV